MSEKFRWGSSEDESGDESSWSGPITLNRFLEQNFNFNNVTETIRTALNRMMLADLKNLKALLESGTVVINEPDQRNQMNDELSQIISKRESTIIENESKDQLIPARRRRNTRGDFRQTNSEGDGPKLVQTGAGPKLVQTGAGPKLVQTGPKTESGRSMDDISKTGP